MNKYYLTLVLRPDLEEKTRVDFLKSVSRKFDKLVKEDLWGVRDLAYKIKKQNKGYYAHYELEMEPQKIKDLDRNLKMEEDVLRFLIVRT